MEASSTFFSFINNRLMLHSHSMNFLSPNFEFPSTLFIVTAVIYCWDLIQLCKNLNVTFQVLRGRPLLLVRQQDLVWVRLRGADGVRQFGLQLLQLGPNKTASPISQWELVRPAAKCFSCRGATAATFRTKGKLIKKQWDIYI